MSRWWNPKAHIPIDSVVFNTFISDFVYDCPSSVKHTKNIGKNTNGKNKKKIYYTFVSARGCSFRERHIAGTLLTTIFTQIKRLVNSSGYLVVINGECSIEDKVISILNESPMKDPFFNLVVYKKRNDMSEAETIFYYIRNSFAHGSFEVLHKCGKNVYLFESSKNGVIKAQMRLDEETLKIIASFSKMKAKQIKSLQKSKKN